MAVPMMWDAGGDRRRGAALRREGLPLAELHREPRRRSAARASTTSTGTRCGRRASTPARCCRSTSGSSGRLSIPAVDSPPDVMITLQPMNIQSRRRRPALVAGDQEVPRPAHRAVRGRHRLDPVLPRPRRPDLRDAPRLDAAGLRRSPAERGVPRALPHLLHQRPDRRRAARTRSASTTCAWEADYPHSDSMWPTAPEELDAPCSRRTTCPTTRSARCRTRTRCAGTRSTLRPHPEGGRDRRRAPPAGRRPRRGGHVAEHPGPHGRREARGLPQPGPASGRRAGLTHLVAPRPASSPLGRGVRPLGPLTPPRRPSGPSSVRSWEPRMQEPRSDPLRIVQWATGNIGRPGRSGP